MPCAISGLEVTVCHQSQSSGNALASLSHLRMGWCIKINLLPKLQAQQIRTHRSISKIPDHLGRLGKQTFFMNPRFSTPPSITPPYLQQQPYFQGGLGLGVGGGEDRDPSIPKQTQIRIIIFKQAMGHVINR